MENVAGVFHTNLSFFRNSNPHKISFYNARGLKVAAHNFMKSWSCDGLAARGLLN